MQTSQGISSAPQPSMIPLSCKGQWQKNLLFNAENKYKNVAIKDLSYEIMSKFENKIENKKRWESWEPCIAREFSDLKITREMTPRLFVRLMVERGFRIQNLLNMADKIDDPSVKKCFYKQEQYLKYVEREVPRIQANKDTSKGFLKDISYVTLKEIADLISSNPFWRIMGDGLGLNLSECIKSSDPFEMLEKWISKNNDGTLKRIFYEAQRLNLANVCEYLEAIPLKKLSSIEIRDPHAAHPVLRMTTIFDLKKLDEIYGANGVQINWEAISHTLFNNCSSSKEDIWLSGNVKLNLLNDAINTHLEEHFECFNQFMEEVHSGVFEPKSLQGVTYNQIAYLAEELSRNGFSSQYSRFNELAENLKVSDFRIKNMSTRSLLCLYWQCNLECDLSQFVQKIIDIFLPNGLQEANTLLRGYHRINPKRYYSARLDEENKKMSSGYLRV